MSNVSGAGRPKPQSQSSNASSSSNSSAPSNNSSSKPSNSSKPKGSSEPQDSFEAADSNKKKNKVNLDGGVGQGSAGVSHDFKTGKTSESGGVELASGEVSASESTGPLLERKDEKELAPGTTASNELRVGEASAGASASGSLDENGGSGQVSLHGELTAFEDEASINSRAKLTDGEKPLISDNTISTSVAGQAEAHANAEAYANTEDGVGGKFDLGASAALTGEASGRAELNTVDENGEKEELASVEVGVHGHAGPAIGLQGGLGYKDGEVTAELGMDFAPGLGGGFELKGSANFENIARDGQKILESAADEVGNLGYQAQQQFGQTLSGIQKFLDGINIFG